MDHSLFDITKAVVFGLWLVFGVCYYTKRNPDCQPGIKTVLCMLAGPLCYLKWSMYWSVIKNQLWHLLYLVVAGALLLVEYFEKRTRKPRLQLGR